MKNFKGRTSKKTWYNNIEFRSRAEARWAVFFDAMGIEYEYEPEGFDLSNGMSYLPDFWLPQSQAFFEVKGVDNLKDVSSEDKTKMFCLAKDTGYPVHLGLNFPQFVAMVSLSWSTDYNDFEEYDSTLAQCTECGNLFFYGSTGAWRCPCCGAWDKYYHMEAAISFNVAKGDCWYSPFVENAIRMPYATHFDHEQFNPPPCKKVFEDIV